MAMTPEKLAYHRAYREAHKEAYSERFKQWHEANGAARYYENLELTRAIKRKSYHLSRGHHIAADAEQQKIDAIRALHPRKRLGSVRRLTDQERLVNRKVTLRKVRYRNVKGIVDWTEPEHCQICGLAGKKMCLDHCHEKGVFRGWLCDDCNIALGRVKENVNILKAMIKYIEKGVTNAA